MKRTRVWALVAGLVFLTLAALWFDQTYERVPYERWEAAQKEALRNPYLGLERLLARLGRPLVRIASPRPLDALPAGGVLLLDRQRRRNVDAARAARLLDWVQRGGYLVVAAESAGDDPLLQRLGVKPYRPPVRDEDDEDSVGTCEAPPPPAIDVRLPGAATRFELRYRGPGLSATQPAPVWRAGHTAERSSLLHYAWGEGQVTVIDGLDFVSNEQLRNFDHAELIWALIGKYQPQGELRLASRLAVPTLWQWLGETAWMLLVSAGVLIALWLWRIVPRFGGALALPGSERRELSQHLAAIGRSLWREGGIGHWLSLVQQALERRLALRHPYLGQLAPAARQEALARLAGCPPAAVEQALSPGAARAANDFTAAMQTLQRLDQAL